MKTIRHLATLVAVPFMLATSINANAAYQVVDSFTSADMGFEAESTGTQNPSTGWWTKTTDWSRSTAQAASGDASLCFAATDLASGANTWAQADITIPEAGTYRFRMQVYVDANCNDGLSVIALNVKDPWRTTSVNIVGTKGEWVTIESNDMAFTEDEIGTVTMIVKLGTTASGDILFYIDDVELVKYVDDEVVTDPEPDVDEDEDADSDYKTVDAATFSSADMSFEAEDANASNPTTGWWASNSAYWSRSTEQAAVGSASLCYSGTNTSDSWVQATINIPEPGTYRYRMQVYVDESCNEGLSTIALQVKAPWEHNLVNIVATKGEWVTIESPDMILTEEEFQASADEGAITYTEGEPVTTTMNMKMFAVTGDVLFYIDNIRLVKYEEPDTTEPDVDVDIDEDSLLTGNPSFETAGTDNGGADGWWTQATSPWIRSTDQAASGVASMCFSGDETDLAAEYFLQTTSANKPVIEEAGTYTYGFEIYIDPSANEDLTTINGILNGTTWLNYSYPLANVEKGVWTYIEHDFEITEANIGAYELRIKLSSYECATGSALVYIDNVVLKQVKDEDDDDTAVGIATTEAADVAVAAKDGAITIAGASNGTAVTVYAVTGAVVANTVVANGTVSVPAASGIYIVKVGTQVTKVAL